MISLEEFVKKYSEVEMTELQKEFFKSFKQKRPEENRIIIGTPRRQGKELFNRALINELESAGWKVIRTEKK